MKTCIIIYLVCCFIILIPVTFEHISKPKEGERILSKSEKIGMILLSPILILFFLIFLFTDKKK